MIHLKRLRLIFVHIRVAIFKEAEESFISPQKWGNYCFLFRLAHTNMQWTHAGAIIEREDIALGVRGFNTSLWKNVLYNIILCLFVVFFYTHLPNSWFFSFFCVFLIESTAVVALDINKDNHDGAACLRESGLFSGCDVPNHLNPLYSEKCAHYWSLLIRI